MAEYAATQPARIGGKLAVRLLALLLLLVALPIAVGGVWLLGLGGSVYYAAGGLIVIAVAVLLWQARSVAGLLYCGFLVATIVWALWEAGLDGWALAPRLVGPGLLGLCFLLPGIGRAIGRKPALASGVGGAACLALALLAALMPGSYGPGRLEAASQPGRVTIGSDDPGQWQNFGRTPGGDRFSPLDQINRDNVAGLKPAWTYHTGVFTPAEGGGPLQATPIMAGDSLYLCTQTNVIIALDPDSGREKWRFDPKVDASGASRVTTCRGVAYFENAASTDCPRRILAATFDVRLLALDAQTGRPCRTFGNGGMVDLRAGMGDVPGGLYYASSAPVVAGGNVILNGWVADNQSTDEPSGVIRAFDAVTGAFRWAWDAGRPGYHGEPAKGEVYTRSTPNSWAPMSVDEALGLVYIPTGNPTPDHWGGKRSAESNRYGSSVVALDMRSGEPRWSFQTAHYDLWDYDIASQPTLLDLTIDGRKVPALIQATKRGEMFLLDRRTGKPLAPVEERAVPQRGTVEPGRLSPTQPFSAGVPSLAGPPLREQDMWGMTPYDQLWCRIAFRKLRYDGPMTPPGTDRSLIYPGIAGGVNWGSVSIDPVRQVMIVNSMQYGSVIRLVPRAETDRLLAQGKQYSHSFALPQPQAGTPYGVQIEGFESPLLAPCNKPPFGTLHAIDLRTRKVLWSRPFGSVRDTGPYNVPLGLPLDMGMPNFGGSLLTGSGLVFIGASHDATFRAYDVNTGKALWQQRLPAGGQANPMTFRSPKTGRQFVVIAAGGHKLLRASPGDAVVAFALPAPQ